MHSPFMQGPHAVPRPGAIRPNPAPLRRRIRVPPRPERPPLRSGKATLRRGDPRQNGGVQVQKKNVLGDTWESLSGFVDIFFGMRKKSKRDLACMSSSKVAVKRSGSTC